MNSGSVCRDCGRTFPWADIYETCATCVGKRLTERWVRDVVEELLPPPEGRYERGGREYRWGSGRGLVIVVGGPKSGVWYDHTSGEGGDLPALIGRCLSGGSAEGLRWARQWLGQSSRKRPARPVPVWAPEDDGETRERAADMWSAAVPQRRGDMVDRYFAGRGICLERLAQANDGKLPGSLRFHPRVWNGETRRYYPAMIAKIVGFNGQFLGVHRTWLVEDENGRVGKAPLKAPKMTLGRFTDQGGCIRLWRPRWDEATNEDTLGLSEGIEDGMTAAQLYPSWRVAAGVSLGGLLSIAVPSALFRVVLIPQNDKPRPGRRGPVELLQDVRDRFRREGRELLLLKSPREVKDINELLQRFSGRRTANGDF